MSQKILYPIIVVSILLATVLGFMVGRYSASEINQTSVSPVNPLFNSQTATFRGKIKSISEKSLLITNSSTQVEGTIGLSNDIKVTKLNFEANGIDEAYKALDLDQEVLVTLELQDGMYAAKLIEYVAPQPSLPPLEVPKQS